MNVTSVTSAASAATQLARDGSAGFSAPASTNGKTKSTNAATDPAAIKKAASQFEAIILRQLLAPAIDPIMSGGLGGKDAAGGGGGVYGFMLTDTLATSLSKGGGLGLASMLEKQFMPRTASTTLTTSAALKANPLSTPSP